MNKNDDNQVSYYPIPKCFKTNIFTHRSALDQAYEALLPSKFVKLLWKAILGNKELANKCEHKRKNTQNLQLLSTRQKNAVRFHFHDFLEQKGYGSQMTGFYMTQLNIYTNRAISSAQKHVARKPENEPESMELSDDEVEL